MQLFILCFTLLLFIGYALLLLYYRRAFLQLPVYSPVAATSPGTTITVIIPARNEAQHIAACLQSITRQSYPARLYEVLVVDDHSTDDTAAIVQQFAHAGVRLISLASFTNNQPLNSYKKKAIEVAIAQATGELIVCTDADCIVPLRWLDTIASFQAQQQASFIAMPVAFTHNTKPIGLFQALDFMTLQGITAASVYKRIHSMCNGANLAYTKAAFLQVQGFKGIDTIASGDDMLLMHKIYVQDPGSVYFLKSPEVIVRTQPVATVKAFFQQRIRWASKADKYDDKRIIAVLLLVYCFNLLLLLMPLWVLFSRAAIELGGLSFTVLQWWGLLLVSKTTIEVYFLYPVARFFSGQQLLLYFPLAQPFHVAYTVIAGWLGKFGSYQWKERQVK